VFSACATQKLAIDFGELLASDRRSARFQHVALATQSKLAAGDFGAPRPNARLDIGAVDGQRPALLVASADE